MSSPVEALTRVLAIMKVESKICMRSGWHIVTVGAAAASALALLMAPPARAADRSLGLAVVALCSMAAAITVLLHALARASFHGSAWERAARVRTLSSTAAALGALFLHTVITGVTIIAVHRMTAGALGVDGRSPSFVDACVLTGVTAMPLGALLASTCFARASLVRALTVWAVGGIATWVIFAGAVIASVDRVPRDLSVAAHLDVLLCAGSLTVAGLLITLASRERSRV